MANRPNTVPHPLNNIQTPSIPEQVLQILLEVVPHMPTESQVSFFSMFRDNASSLPFHEAPKAPYPLAHPSLLPDSLHNYVQAKTVQHLFESDLAFEAKQQVSSKTSRRSDRSKGITKRYDKPQKNQAWKKRVPITIFPLANPRTTPYIIPRGTEAHPCS